MEGCVREKSCLDRLAVKFGMVSEDATPPNWRCIGLVFIALFSSSISLTFIFPFLPEMILYLGYSETQKGSVGGFVAAAVFAGRVFGSFFWGWLADKRGRKLVLLITISFNGLFSLLFGFSQSLAMALAFRFLCGAFNGTVGTAKAILYDISDNSNQALSMSFLAIAWALGLIVGPLAGGVLASPAKKWPHVIGESTLFGQFPYLLASLIPFVFCGIIFVVIFFKFDETLIGRRQEQTLSPSQADSNHEGEESGCPFLARPAPLGSMQALGQSMQTFPLESNSMAYHAWQESKKARLRFRGVRGDSLLGYSDPNLYKNCLGDVGHCASPVQYLSIPNLNSRAVLSESKVKGLLMKDSVEQNPDLCDAEGKEKVVLISEEQVSKALFDGDVTSKQPNGIDSSFYESSKPLVEETPSSLREFTEEIPNSLKDRNEEIPTSLKELNGENLNSMKEEISKSLCENSRDLLDEETTKPLVNGNSPLDVRHLNGLYNKNHSKHPVTNRQGMESAETHHSTRQHTDRKSDHVASDNQSKYPCTDVQRKCPYTDGSVNGSVGKGDARECLLCDQGKSIKVIIEDEKKRPDEECGCMVWCCTRSCCGGLRESSLAQLLRLKDVWKTIILYCVMSFTVIAIDDIFPVFASTRQDYGGMGFSSDEIGLALGVITLPLLCLQAFLYPFLVRHLGIRKSFLLCCSVSMVFSQLVPLVRLLNDNPVMQWVSLLVVQIPMKISVNCCFAATSLLINNSVTPDLAAQVNGLGMMLTAIGRSIAPILAGLTFSWTVVSGEELGPPFDVSMTFFILGLLQFVAVLEALFLHPRLDSQKK